MRTRAPHPGAQRETSPVPAELPGYLAVAPLAVCLLGLAFAPTFEMRDLLQRVAVAYGAVLLAVFGAVHWGLVLAGRFAWTALRLAGAFLPAMFGAAAVVLGGQRGLAVLVAGFGLFWLYEHRMIGAELPAEYLRLRRHSSVAVCALLALVTIASDSAGLA